jgi:hypothetical protein
MGVSSHLVHAATSDCKFGLEYVSRVLRGWRRTKEDVAPPVGWGVCWASGRGTAARPGRRVGGDAGGAVRDGLESGATALLWLCLVVQLRL